MIILIAINKQLVPNKANQNDLLIKSLDQEPITQKKAETKIPALTPYLSTIKFAGKLMGACKIICKSEHKVIIIPGTPYIIFNYSP